MPLLTLERDGWNKPRCYRAKECEEKMLGSLKENWLVYTCEALGLGVFMVSACFFSVVLFHPGSSASGWGQSLRFLLIGIAMGLTAIGIFLSPFGKLSGAHINPSVTLTFWRLGKIKGQDAIFYAIFQFIGASAGVGLSWLVLGDALSAKEVSFAITVPDASGWVVSFLAEFLISFGMMTMVLITTNHSKLFRYTPFIAGFFVAAYIFLEAPVSGMSMNPARTFGSAVFANNWEAWWVYFTAPPLAMLAAGEAFVRLRGVHSVLCAKIDHSSKMRCIFNCSFDGRDKRPGMIEVTKDHDLFSNISNGLF